MAEKRVYIRWARTWATAPRRSRGGRGHGRGGHSRRPRRSSLYRTEPVDAPPQAWFLNAVVEAETSLMPRQLLRALAAIERAFGRRRIVARGPRTLDLDICCTARA